MNKPHEQSQLISKSGEVNEFSDNRLADWTVLAGRWYYRRFGDWQVDLSEDDARNWVVAVHHDVAVGESTYPFKSFPDAVECALGEYSKIAKQL